ncbi:MAG TPA: hypothetical protein VGB94_05605 [Acidobacteriaceae bacterium]
MLSLSSARCLLLGTLLVSGSSVSFAAQTPAAATSSAGRAGGTVQTITGSDLTLKTDTGQLYTVHVKDGARLLQVPPGSKDLSAAQPFALSDITAGDRILVNGTPGDAPASITAVRIVLMKEAAIADLHAKEQADWQHRGSGGLVKSVDSAAQTIWITSGGKSVTIQLQRNTILRRYAPDSVAFESAQPGTFAQIRPGDQLRVRGSRSEDGTIITADEVVSGSFLNVAGPITAVDATLGTLTVKDLTTKRSILVHTTAVTSLRKLDARASAMFLARLSGTNGAAHPASAAPTTSTSPAGAPESAPRTHPNMDLAAIIQRMPAITLADLHTGDAVMLVASASSDATTSVTAITVLGGVEQVLSATPKGGQVMQLSPFSMSAGGSDMSEMGGSTQ